MTTATRAELERLRNKLTNTKAKLRYYREVIENMKVVMRLSNRYWTKGRRQRREELYELEGSYGRRALSQERAVRLLVKKVEEEEARSK